MSSQTLPNLLQRLEQAALLTPTELNQLQTTAITLLLHEVTQLRQQLGAYPAQLQQLQQRIDQLERTAYTHGGRARPAPLIERNIAPIGTADTWIEQAPRIDESLKPDDLRHYIERARVRYEDIELSAEEQAAIAEQGKRKPLKVSDDMRKQLINRQRQSMTPEQSQAMASLLFAILLVFVAIMAIMFILS